MKMNVIEQIKKIVKEECEKETNMFTMDAYHSHIVPMVQYSLNLAKKLGADEEIVEIAAWLHDIGSVTGDYENHHTAGAKYAENLLKNLNYPQEKIEAVKHCIIAHRGSVKILKNSIEAEVIASADCMSHLNNITSLFNLALVIRKMSIDEARIFCKNKLQKFWDKITIPEAKELVKDKYEAAMLLLK